MAVAVAGTNVLASSANRLRAASFGRGERVLTAGGRVLTVVASGDNYGTAIDRAYAAVAKISFDGMQYRRDIGRKALTT